MIMLHNNSQKIKLYEKIYKRYDCLARIFSLTFEIAKFYDFMTLNSYFNTRRSLI